jgi:hypothetical protein
VLTASNTGTLVAPVPNNVLCIAAQRVVAGDAQREPAGRKRRAFAQDLPPHVPRLRAERHPKADLRPALGMLNAITDDRRDQSCAGVIRQAATPKANA